MRAIYFDTETTGLSPTEDRIVELAALDATTGQTFCEFIHPGRPIPPDATRISGITDAMVANAADFATVAKAFLEFCEEDVVLIAHNGESFDMPFMRAEFSRAGVVMPASWKSLDTLKWARRYRPDLPRHSLQYLREVYGIEANNAHRALDDVLVLKQVFDAMTDDLSIPTIFDLLHTHTPTQKSNAPDGPITVMPFGKHKGKPMEQIPKDYVAWLAKDGAFGKPENQALREAFVQCGLLS